MHFTHRELRLVRCNRRDLDRSRLWLVRLTENRSRHFRDEGQPPGEPSAQFGSPADPNAGSGALVAPEFHSRSQARAILSFLSILLHGDTHTQTQPCARARARRHVHKYRRRCPSRRVTTWLFQQTSHILAKDHLESQRRDIFSLISCLGEPSRHRKFRKRRHLYSTRRISFLKPKSLAAEFAEKSLARRILTIQSPDESRDARCRQRTEHARWEKLTEWRWTVLYEREQRQLRRGEDEGARREPHDTHLRSYRAQTSDRARSRLYSLSFPFFLSLDRRLKNPERRRHRSSLPRSFDPPARSFGLPDALRLKLNRGSLLPREAAPATTNHRRHATSAPLPCHSRRAGSRAPLVNKTHPRGRL